MEIVGFDSGMADAVARCYRDAAASAPFCAPVEGRWFTDLGRLARHPVREEVVLVAREGARIAGFVHAAVAAPATEQWHVAGEPGVVRFLAYRPGERAVGKALLEAAEAWLRGRGRAEIIAGHSAFMYPFYHLPFAHMSERMAHITALFGMAGYVPAESEVLFEWPEFDPPSVPRPGLDVEVRVERRDIDTLGPGVAVNALRKGREVAECLMVRLDSQKWRPELAGRCFCSSLHVDDAFQGKGLGKHLLSVGLGEMKRDGMRHALISTEWNNHRAYLFYANFGFRFLDRTFSFRKQLASGRRRA